MSFSRSRLILYSKSKNEPWTFAIARVFFTAVYTVSTAGHRAHTRPRDDDCATHTDHGSGLRLASYVTLTRRCFAAALALPSSGEARFAASACCSPRTKEQSATSAAVQRRSGS